MHACAPPRKESRWLNTPGTALAASGSGWSVHRCGLRPSVSCARKKWERGTYFHTFASAPHSSSLMLMRSIGIWNESPGTTGIASRTAPVLSVIGAPSGSTSACTATRPDSDTGEFTRSVSRSTASSSGARSSSATSSGSLPSAAVDGSGRARHSARSSAWMAGCVESWKSVHVRSVAVVSCPATRNVGISARASVYAWRRRGRGRTVEDLGVREALAWIGDCVRTDEEAQDVARARVGDLLPLRGFSTTGKVSRGLCRHLELHTLLQSSAREAAQCRSGA
jgi:hypothetical protein